MQPFIQSFGRSLVKHPRIYSGLFFLTLTTYVVVDVHQENERLKAENKSLQNQCSHLGERIDSLKLSAASDQLKINQTLDIVNQHQLQHSKEISNYKKKLIKTKLLKYTVTRKLNTQIRLLLVALVFTSRSVAYRNRVFDTLDQKIQESEANLKVVTKARDKLYQRTLEQKKQLDQAAPRQNISQVLAASTFHPPANPESVSKRAPIGLVLSTAHLYKLSVRALRSQGRPAPSERCIMAEIAYWKSQSAIPNSWSTTEIPDGVMEIYNQELVKFAEKKKERKITHTNLQHTHVSGECPQVSLNSVPVKVTTVKNKVKPNKKDESTNLISLDDDLTEDLEQLAKDIETREAELANVCVTPPKKIEPLTNEEKRAYIGSSDFTISQH